MRTDADQERHQRHSTEPNAQLCSISRARERYAEVLVLLVTVVLHAHGERAAAVVHPAIAPFPHDAALAALQQPESGGDLFTIGARWAFYHQPAEARVKSRFCR